MSKKRRRSETINSDPPPAPAVPPLLPVPSRTGSILVIPPYPIYRTVILYGIIWIGFFIFPLYIVYSSLNKTSLSVPDLCLAFALALLTIIRFGAVASLPHVVVISGFMLAATAHPEVHSMVTLLMIVICGMYLYFFARNAYQINLIKKSIELTDEGINNANRKTIASLRRLQSKKRRGMAILTPLIMALFAWMIINRPDFGSLAWFMPLSLLLHFGANYYMIEFDRFYVIENEGKRRIVYFRLKYIDKQFVEFLETRGVGFVVFLALYGFVITVFAFVYYYVDHCESRDVVCSRIVDLRKFNADPSKDDPPTPYRNFSAIDPLLGCEEGKRDCPISLRQFLPYLYFSVVTTTTVGYGDISPRTVTATWLVIIHHLIAITLLIGVAGQVAGMVAQQRTP
jgi:hypothetical protein